MDRFILTVDTVGKSFSWDELIPRVYKRWKKIPKRRSFSTSMKEARPSLAETRYQLDAMDLIRSKTAFVPGEPLQTRHGYSFKGEIVVFPDGQSACYELTFSVSICATSLASGFSSHSGAPVGSFKNATMD